MTQKSHAAAIGLFVVVGAAIALAAVFVLGSGRLFRHTTPAVLYFEDSVAGLDPGAPVEFNGVRLGLVTDIRMVYDAHQLSTRIPVHIAFESDRIVGLRRATGEKPGDRIRHGITNGLRARLETQSLITGKLKVVLVHKPDAPPAEVVEEDGVLVIPTVSGLLEELTAKLEELPLRRIVHSLDDSLQRIAQLLDSPALAASVTNLNHTLELSVRIADDLDRARIDETAAELRKLSEHLRAAVPAEALAVLTTNLNAAVDESRATLKASQTAFASSQEQLAGLTAELTPAARDAGQAFRELGETARAVRRLADYLERHPEALLQGKAAKDQP